MIALKRVLRCYLFRELLSVRQFRDGNSLARNRADLRDLSRTHPNSREREGEKGERY